jgi:RNA polymerase sigma-70 factor (TIGR02960 family)
MWTVDESLIDRARAGDEAAFRDLTDPYRRELQLHCYRMLGSLQDAEDILQETLMAAWRGLDGYAERASLRTWLYRIATNRCLNAIRDRREPPPPAVPLPPPTRLTEQPWLEPYPDALLEFPDPGPGPDAIIEKRESIGLAFVAATQSLPVKQRAVLVLRDVLGFRAAETAEILETTEEAVNSALKRARAGLRTLRPDYRSIPLPSDPHEEDVVRRFAAAFEAGDIPGIVALLTDDAWLTMPPLPLEYQGKRTVAQFLQAISFREGRQYRLVPTKANMQPAFGCYLRRPSGWEAHGILVLTMRDGRISVCTRYMDTELLGYFGLPESLPA